MTIQKYNSFSNTTKQKKMLNMGYENITEKKKTLGQEGDE